MDDGPRLLMLQFLQWIADRPRTYADVLEAWRSSCPRHPVWEDAVIGGLVRHENNGVRAVTLTPKGRALLEREAAPSAPLPTRTREPIP